MSTPWGRHLLASDSAVALSVPNASSASNGNFLLSPEHGEGLGCLTWYLFSRMGACSQILWFGTDTDIRSRGPDQWAVRALYGRPKNIDLSICLEIRRLAIVI